MNYNPYALFNPKSHLFLMSDDFVIGKMNVPIPYMIELHGCFWEDEFIFNELIGEINLN